jgi:hypothetical protein
MPAPPRLLADRLASAMGEIDSRVPCGDAQDNTPLADRPAVRVLDDEGAGWSRIDLLG